LVSICIDGDYFFSYALEGFIKDAKLFRPILDLTDVVQLSPVSVIDFTYNSTTFDIHHN